MIGTYRLSKKEAIKKKTKEDMFLCFGIFFSSLQSHHHLLPSPIPFHFSVLLLSINFSASEKHLCN